MKRLVWAFAFLTLSSSMVSAQSLVEVARKEKERRKKVEAEGKRAFTETDLRSTNFSTPAPAAGASSSAAASEGQAASTEAGGTDAAAKEDPTKTQAYWRDRAQAINQRIRDLEAKLQSPELTMNTRGAPQRQAAERDLAQAKSELSALGDEARKKGVPPGWLR